MYSYNSNHFLLVGTIQFYGGAINALGTNMTFVLGEFGFYTSQSGSTAFANIQINSCLLNFIPRITQPYIYIAGNNNVLACNLGSNGISGIQNGNNNIYWATPLTNDPTNTTYLNIATGESIFAYNITSKRYLNMGISSYIQASYGSQVWKNMYIPPIYYTLLNATKDYEPNIYMMENVEMYKTQSINWHYRFYHYPAQDGKYNRIKFLNIDTDESSNVKKCINNRQTNIDATWWRRLEFNMISENGNPLQDVAIKIMDGAGNEYTGISDINGYSYIDVLEQRTIFTQEMGIISTWNGTKDTYYSEFDIILSKPGFIDYKLFVVEARQLGKQVIALIPVLPVVYSDLRIETSIESQVELEVIEKVEDKIVSICELTDDFEAIINLEPITKITADYEEYRNI